jgi:hypothetical protein
MDVVRRPVGVRRIHLRDRIERARDIRAQQEPLPIGEGEEELFLSLGYIRSGSRVAITAEKKQRKETQEDAERDRRLAGGTRSHGRNRDRSQGESMSGARCQVVTVAVVTVVRGSCLKLVGLWAVR